MTRHSFRAGLLFLLLAATLAGHPVLAADESCPESQPATLTLPRSRQALAGRQEMLVVAIGSSTTESWMSSDPAHSYPAVLQAELENALPQAHVAVINRGIGGQDAAEEVARLDRDVLALRPVLVIWQVGANGALRDTDPAVFRKLVAAGVGQLKGGNLDIVLMDNQRAPRILGSPGHAAIDRALAETAHASGVNLFSRGALMDAWRDEGFPYERFISPDGLHHNDLGYRCLARALAHAVVSAVKSPAMHQAKADAGPATTPR